MDESSQQEPQPSLHTTTPPPNNCVQVVVPVVARILLPDDANPVGNVHGGTILQLMEQAGIIVATRFVNNNSSHRNGNGNESQLYEGEKYAVLTRFETMSFHRPMFIGNVASVTASIVFTSERSVLLNVIVTAEDIATGSKKITNSGLLWYTCFVRTTCTTKSSSSSSLSGSSRIIMVPVPQILPPKENSGPKFDEYTKAKLMYELRKNNNKNDTLDEEYDYDDSDEDYNKFLATNATATATTDVSEAANDTISTSTSTTTLAKTPSDSQQQLCQMVLPSDCTYRSHIAFGGFVMKLMDNAAGCCAYRHCRTNVVTISISAMDLTNFIRLGDVVTIDAKLLFCSSKSMEIAVSATSSSIRKQTTTANENDNDNDVNNVIVAKGIYTFVSLDTKGKPMTVPTVRYETETELKQAYAAKRKYEQAKKERMMTMK